MSRNYLKESEWEKNKYKRLVAKVDTDLAERFLNALDKPYAVWLKEEINKFLENKEEIIMEKMINELREELLNKELTLCDMDNIAERITESSTSVFDAIEDCLAQKSCGYAIREDKNIIVEFEVVEENEDPTEIKVKVTDIWED